MIAIILQSLREKETGIESKFLLYTLFIILLLCGSLRSFSQVTVSSSDTITCGATCTTLTATVTGSAATSSGLSTADDMWSSTLNIGFTFTYFGIPYTQCLVGTNGVVGFDLTVAGVYNTWQITNTLAATAASGGGGGLDIHNLIAGVWCDLYLAAGGTVSYATVGVAPNRKFEVTFCADHMFSCTAQYTTSQIILYETSNIVEVHIGYKTVCVGWNGGYGEVGVVNQTGSSCTVAPGPVVRDFPNQWSALDEAWQFTPNVAGTAYTVTSIPFAPVPSGSSTIYWYNATTGAYMGAGATMTVCPTTTTTYAAGALSCSDTSFGYYTVIPTSGTATPITGNTSVCAGSTTTLSDASAGGTWSSGNSSVATVGFTGTVYGVSAGAATITYITSGGCSSTATVTVIAAPSTISGNTTVCTGSAIMLSDAVSGGTWSLGIGGVASVSGTGVVTGISAGNAVISYSTGPGCVVTTTVMVSPAPSPITGGNAMCTSSTLQLSDAAIGGTWSSDNTNVATISTTGIVTGVSSGTTDISYTLGSCATGEVMTVGGIHSVTGDSSICEGSTTSLSDATAGGTWSSSNTAVATVDASGTVTGITAGYSFIWYSAGGCTTFRIVTVIPSSGAGTITAPPAVCVGATITLSDDVTGGVWSISNGNAIISDTMVTGVSAGMDTVSYAVTSPLCGTAVATAVIAVDLPPDAGAITGDTSVCAGATINLSDPVSGGIWGSSNSSVAYVSGRVVTGVVAGTATIGYVITNLCGTASTTKDVTVLTAPSAGNISGTPVVCIGAVLPLSDNVSGGAWSSNGSSIATISGTGVVTALAAGVVVITYTTGPNVGGCYGTDTFSISIVHSAFTITSTVTDVSCYGDNNGSITTGFSGSISSVSYSWSNGNNTSGITGLGIGPYTLTVRDSTTQCVVKDSFNITQPDSLSLSDSTTDDLCHAGTGIVSVTVSGGTPSYTYAWSNGGKEATISNLVAGTYSVIVTDSNSCTKNISAVVQEDTCYSILIHDVITPNGDGINDVWVIEGISEYPDNTVAIFDKWGDEVYEATNYKNNWGGKGKGHELPDGTYYYLVKLNAKNIMGGGNTFTGYLLIKR